MKTEVDTNGDHPYLASSAKLLGRKSDDKKKRMHWTRKSISAMKIPNFEFASTLRWDGSITPSSQATAAIADARDSGA
jgi:hypothetical protein